MDNFLTFLSNNYIYFLIAAGVLFFALIGFLIDLKKKKESEAAPDLYSIPYVNSVPEDVNIEDIVNKNVNLNNQSTEAATEFNPAPPMPQEEIIQVSSTNNEAAGINNTPGYNGGVVNQGIPTQQAQPVQNTENIISNNQINQ